MEQWIEQGWNNTTMKRPGCEIHHSRDEYANYTHMMRHLRQPVGLHHHDFYEIFLFLSGEMEYHIENRMYHMQPGDLLLISPLELHQPVFVPAQGFYERIVLWVQPSALQALCAENEDLSACFNCGKTLQSNLLQLAKAQSETILLLLRQLVEVTHADTAFAKTCEQALLSLILVKINTFSLEAQREKEAPPAAQLLSKHTTAAVQYIAAHLTEPLLLSHVARACFVSEQHLLRVFKAEMGVSVHRYITQKKLLTARQYMQNGVPAAEAARQCGFANYTTFWRCYKKEYGDAPRQGILSAAK